MKVRTLIQLFYSVQAQQTGAPQTAVAININSQFQSIGSYAESMATVVSGYTSSIIASGQQKDTLAALGELAGQLQNVDGLMLAMSTQTELDQSDIGSAFESLADLFSALAANSDGYDGSFQYILPTVINAVQQVVIDLGSLNGYGCSYLATWSPVESVYNGILSAMDAFTLNMLLPSVLPGQCTSYAVSGLKTVSATPTSISDMDDLDGMSSTKMTAASDATSSPDSGTGSSTSSGKDANQAERSSPSFSSVLFIFMLTYI